MTHAALRRHQLDRVTIRVPVAAKKWTITWEKNLGAGSVPREVELVSARYSALSFVYGDRVNVPTLLWSKRQIEAHHAGLNYFAVEDKQPKASYAASRLPSVLDSTLQGQSHCSSTIDCPRPRSPLVSFSRLPISKHTSITCTVSAAL